MLLVVIITVHPRVSSMKDLQRKGMVHFDKMIMFQKVAVITHLIKILRHFLSGNGMMLGMDPSMEIIETTLIILTMFTHQMKIFKD